MESRPSNAVMLVRVGGMDARGRELKSVVGSMNAW